MRIISGKVNEEAGLKREDRGYFTGMIEGLQAGDRYLFTLDKKESYPDPVSRFQPDGVHGPSQIIDPDEFSWDDDEWKGTPLRDFIIYELHVGAFTKEGTFEAIIPHLDYLADLGITAIELMPVAQFPGGRNWGYDGVYPFAPQNTYGGPNGLKKLVNAAHNKRLSVILDVVYNHLGPEGNYLSRFAPYFTDKYRTPWGEAVNFDGPYSDEVKHFFISNALYWLNEYHIDALRIDAVHGIFDFSASHFLKELSDTIDAQRKISGKNLYLIAESDLNDERIVNPVEIGGFGLDAQWNDDFHHSLHALITGENSGYYRDFGKVEHLEKAFTEGFVYSGQYSGYRKRRHGNSSKDRPAQQFVVFSQSHDQVGNRMAGDRLSGTQSLEKLKLAAGVVILSPFIPLLFMGEEYGETAPFQYFISHSDDALVQAVRKGRREEFASFGWEGDIPDPQAEKTFFDSKITIGLHEKGRHKVLFAFYKELIRLRKTMPALCNLSKEDMEVRCYEDRKAMFVRRWFTNNVSDNAHLSFPQAKRVGNLSEKQERFRTSRNDRMTVECGFIDDYLNDEVFCLYNFGEDTLNIVLPLPSGTWDKLLESSSERWGGKGDHAEDEIETKGSGVTISLQPHSFVLFSCRHSREGGNPVLK